MNLVLCFDSFVQDDVNLAEKSEFKRQLDIVFTKLENIDFDVGWSTPLLSASFDLYYYLIQDFIFETILFSFFKISGISVDIQSLQKDLEFLKKGFNSLFDLIPSSGGGASRKCIG